MEEILIALTRIMVIAQKRSTVFIAVLFYYEYSLLAGMLIIWDRIFGTFAPESEKVIYGLVHPLNSWNPLWAQFHHLYYIISNIGSKKGFSNKIFFLLKGPGWSPGKPRLGNIEDIPQVQIVNKSVVTREMKTSVTCVGVFGTSVRVS